MFQNAVEKRNPYQCKKGRRRTEATPASPLCPPYNMPYPSRRVKADC